MKVIILDKASAIKATIDDDTGFLTAPVSLARPGVQYYLGSDLGLKDRALERIGVFRPPEEVFNQDSINSFVNLVVTDNHPPTSVDVSNVKRLQIGTVSGVDVDDSLLSGVITITDQKTIKQIKDGKIEVSVGYSNDLEDRKGDFNGEDYEFVQTNIRANHLAIVDAGRCGKQCKITLDHKEETTQMVITIDGIQYTVEDTQLAQAIQNKQKAWDEEKEAMVKKLEEETDEKEKAIKGKEKAEATADAAKKEIITDAAMNDMVGERAKLLVDSKIILGDKALECNDCPKEMKTAVIDKVMSLDMAGKSDDYIEAMYDAAVAKFEKAKGSLDKLNKNFSDADDNLTVDDKREAAREQYIKDNLGEGE